MTIPFFEYIYKGLTKFKISKIIFNKVNIDKRNI